MADGQQDPSLMESALGGIVKSAASGIGTFIADRATQGRYSEYKEKHQEEAQGQLLKSLQDRSSKGEVIGTEDLREWTNAGGDPSVISQLQRDALGINKARIESAKNLDLLHQHGGIDDNTYSMMSLALFDKDPQMQALAMAQVHAQMGLLNKIATTQATEQIKHQEAANAPISSAQKEHEAESEKLAGQHEARADTRAQEARGEREKLQERSFRHQEKIRQMDTAAQQAGLSNQIGKAVADVGTIVAAGNTGKDTDKGAITGKAGNKVSDEQVTLAGMRANHTLATEIARTPQPDPIRLITDGFWHADIDVPRTGAMSVLGAKGTHVYGTGMLEMVTRALSKLGDAEGSKRFAAAYRKAIAEKDPQKGARLFDAGITELGRDHPELQKQIEEQIGTMVEDVNSEVETRMTENPPREESEDDESYSDPNE